MKKASIFLFLGLLALVPHFAFAQMDVDVGYFYDKLAPYGEWLTVDPYGYVWSPLNVDPDWRPYTDGDWVYSDYGWTYDSNYDWAWACYHYGRWAFDRRHGWIWVPGTEWGPAWVAWRWGGGFAGWAPLPPNVGFRAGIGLEFGDFDFDTGIDAMAWSFVPDTWFGVRGLGRHIEVVGRNVTLMRDTRNYTNYQFAGNKYFNRGIPREEVEKINRRQIPVYNVGDARSEKGYQHFSGQQLQIFRPRITASAVNRQPLNTMPDRRLTSVSSVERLHEAELKKLNARQLQQNIVLERQHREQLRVNSNQNNSNNAELIKRHETEYKAQQDYHAARTVVLQSRHDREYQTVQKKTQKTKH